MAKIFIKMHNPYVLCAVTHSLTLMLVKNLHQITKHNMTKAVTGQAHTTGWVGGGGGGGKEGRCLYFQLEPYKLHVYACLLESIVLKPHVNRLRIDNR